MELIFLLSLLLLVLRAVGDLALVIIALVACRFAHRYIPSGPSIYERLKRAYKAY